MPLKIAPRWLTFASDCRSESSMTGRYAKELADRGDLIDIAEPILAYFLLSAVVRPFCLRVISLTLFYLAELGGSNLFKFRWMVLLCFLDWKPLGIPVGLIYFWTKLAIF